MSKKNERNAGRKKKYGEKTKMVSFRVPESKVDEVRKLVYEWLKKNAKLF